MGKNIVFRGNECPSRYWVNVKPTCELSRKEKRCKCGTLIDEEYRKKEEFRENLLKEIGGIENVKNKRR